MRSFTTNRTNPIVKPNMVRLLLSCAVLVVLVCAGCGGEREAGEKNSTTATVSDTEPGPLGYRPWLSPGTYVTTKFQPALTFRVDTEGWFADEPNERWAFMEDLKAEKAIDLLRPNAVLVPSNQKKQTAVPVDLLGWLARHPNLEPLGRSRVTIGGVTGEALDVSVASTPRRSQCDEPCVALVRAAEGFYTPYHLETGNRARFVLLEVGGERVLIAIKAKGDGFSAWLEEAKQILATVSWIR